ncbi:MAG: NosD domain-containing protein [Candidatus Hodarchaeota archaeon]
MLLVEELRNISKLKNTSAQGTENFFINNESWVDYTTDEDKNGFFDSLVIANISLSNFSQIFYLLGVLKSTNGQCLGIDEEIIQPSSNNISLTFDGQAINTSGENGYYEIWMCITTNPDYWGCDLALMYLTSQTYNSNDFEEASAIIVGFSDTGYDVDDDNSLEGITLKVTIKVQEAGGYRLDLRLESVNPYFSESSNITASWRGYLNSSIKTIMVNISARSFYSTKLNGSFTLDMASLAKDLIWAPYIYQHFWINAYNTSFYHFSQFKTPDLYFTGNYFDRGQDTDTDGRFNELFIDIEINSTLNGSYSLKLFLSTVKGDNSFNEIVSGVWEIGIHTVSISFDVSTLYSQQLETPYRVNSIIIRNSENKIISSVHSPHITRVYNYTEFDPPAAFLTGNYADWGFDTDSDGLFNQLIIDTEMNVTIGGVYELELSLIFPWEGSRSYLEEVVEVWEVGIHTVSTYFNITPLYSQQINSDYNVRFVRIKNETSNIIGLVNYPHITRLYNYTEFDPPAIYLTGNYNDWGNDYDGNGLFNQLIIEVELNITIAGSYYIGIRLESTEVFNKYNKTLTFSQSVEEYYYYVGIFNVHFIFSGISLFYSPRLNTSYRIDYITFSDIWPWWGEGVYNPYITRVYNYSEFDPPVAFLTGILNDWGQDTDGDGLFNQLIIEVKINVTIPSTYVISVFMRSTVGYLIFSGEVEDYFSVGFHSLAIPIDTNSYATRLNSSYFLDEALITDQNSIIDRVRNLEYITRIYNFTEFDGYGAVLTGKYSDWGLDTDGNGRYDRLIIEAEVNFTTPGEYHFKLGLTSYAQKDISVGGFNTGYWEMGIRNISIPVDTALFYPTSINSVYMVENISVYDSKNQLLAEDYNPYITRIYNFTEFDISILEINGNSEFYKLIQAENWKGDGSQSNPYTIEGLSLKSISSSGRVGNLIHIRNTNVSFCINNCSLMGGELGIWLFDVKNGNISHNIIQGNKKGILLEYADNNTIAYNTINENSMGVTIGTQGWPEPVHIYCSNNLIVNNAIFDNGIFGLSFGAESEGNIVKWNDFRSNYCYDKNQNNTFSENYWYANIHLIGNTEINPSITPNHLSRPVILFPNWGETLISKVLIDWIPAKDSLGHHVEYNIYYSSDNGTAWNLLASELNTTNYHWDLQNISLGSTYLIKIVAFDSYGFYAMDISDHPFTILSPPSPPSTLPFRFVTLLMLFSILIILIKKKS